MSERRTIPGYSRYVCDADGNVYGVHGTRLRPQPNRQGYLQISVRSDEGRMNLRMAHRLVVAAFYGPIPEGMWVNHKNGIRDDNRIDNLEITTPGENHRHAYAVLKRTRAIGVIANQSTLTEDSIRAIRELRRQGWTHKRLGQAFNVSAVSIRNIIKGKTWTHVE